MPGSGITHGYSLLVPRNIEQNEIKKNSQVLIGCRVLTLLIYNSHNALDEVEGYAPSLRAGGEDWGSSVWSGLLFC